jgi:hypothetical protein
VTDESHWSTRYYVADCPDLRITMRTDGPDDRPDPTTGGVACLLPQHGPHPLTRISPDTYQQINADDDDDDRLHFDADDDEIDWADDDPRWNP